MRGNLYPHLTFTSLSSVLRLTLELGNFCLSFTLGQQTNGFLFTLKAFCFSSGKTLNLGRFSSSTALLNFGLCFLTSRNRSLLRSLCFFLCLFFQLFLQHCLRNGLLIIGFQPYEVQHKCVDENTALSEIFLGQGCLNLCVELRSFRGIDLFGSIF